MIPGPDVIIACPRCGGFAKHESILTGNTLGQQMWSDGKIILPMLPSPPPFIRCHACREFFWLTMARVIDKTSGQFQNRNTNAPDPRWKETQYIVEPDQADYEEALQHHLPKTPQGQRMLRRLALQRRNDRFRQKRGLDDAPRDPPDSAATGVWRDNLVALLAFYTPDGGADQLMLRGELLRGLLRFAEAEATYERIRTPELRLWARKLATLSARGISTPRLLA